LAIASARCPWFGVGATALALFPPADPFVSHESKTGVHHMAFEVRDLTVAAATAATAGVPAAEYEPNKGLGGARRLMLSPQATVGVKTYLSEPLPVEPSRGGWVERIDHLGVASADNDAATEVFGRRLGCPLESTQTDVEVHIAVESFTSDKYGVVYHTRAPVPVGGLRVAFITVGDCELEFLQDVYARQGGRVAHGSPGSTQQDQGAIGRFIAARGPGLHHVALKVTDVDGALASLKRAGHSLIDTAGRPGSRRALIGFIHPKSLKRLV
jgi:catechol 2,3-dioxygenase-like lactoylglutathione lyase family enzyme